ncbi:MAG: TetR/AcrR family transcriptional regulator [Flavobacteriales bacterium]|nr:TetR/AcrR family transcriptional regulator [Flavobacteriales bacterium]
MTRDKILETADQLIRTKGYNAFSFRDISDTVGIRKASIHYHFPTKSALGVAILQKRIGQFHKMQEKYSTASPLQKLKAFLSIYEGIHVEEKVCLVGALATDWNTVDDKIREELKLLSEFVLDWVSQILAEGKAEGVFEFEMESRTKALMIITNLIAVLQLSRLTKAADFELVTKTILNELEPKV